MASPKVMLACHTLGNISSSLQRLITTNKYFKYRKRCIKGLEQREDF